MLFPWQKEQIKRSNRFKRNNKILIEELKKQGIVQNNILCAIEKVPRELFVEKKFIQQAYENIPLPIDCGQTISQPYIVAYMISQLKLKNTDKILEIGTGTGYQTAILSHLCREVCTIEIYNELLDRAQRRIASLNLKNINFKLGNGIEGWKKDILFDAIIISAVSEKIPTKLLENLKNEGSLIMPIKNIQGDQKLILVKKNKKTILKKELCNVKFVPLLN